MRKLALVFAMMSVIAIAGSLATATAAAAKPTRITALDKSVARAAAYAQAHHVRVGVGIVDTKTGAMYAAGLSGRRFPSASVVKVYMATADLRIHHGKLPDSDKSLAWRMITRSDNAAFESLLSKYFGGSAVRLFDWVRDNYSFRHLGGPTPINSCWGSTRITARGIARLYQKILADPEVRPWLLSAMSHYKHVVDGFNQAFGIPYDLPKSAIKQGWSYPCSPVGPYTTAMNSTGVVQSGRFSVAILTESERSIESQRPIINRIAQLALAGTEGL